MNETQTKILEALRSEPLTFLDLNLKLAGVSRGSCVTELYSLFSEGYLEIENPAVKETELPDPCVYRYRLTQKGQEHVQMEALTRACETDNEGQD